MVLAFTFAILFSIPLNVTDKAKADTSATTGVGKIYLEESSANAPDARFAVSTYDSWELGTEMSFSVGLDNVSFNSEYLALSLKAEKSTGLVIVRIGVNGIYFNAGQISATNIATAVTSTGNSFNIEQKFGYWFFSSFLFIYFWLYWVFVAARAFL